MLRLHHIKDVELETALNMLATIEEKVGEVEQVELPFGLPWFCRQIRLFIENQIVEPDERPYMLPPTDLLHADVRSRLRFTPIEFAEVRPDWWGLLACGGVDVMWTDERIDLSETPKQIRTIYRVAANEGRIVDVQYSRSDLEGESCLWVATERSGVHMVSLAGDLIAKFDSTTGLPPYDVPSASVIKIEFAYKRTSHDRKQATTQFLAAHLRDRTRSVFSNRTFRHQATHLACHAFDR